MHHLLLLRFSAFGDILMTIPVIDSLSRQYPKLKITMVSQPFVGPLFNYLPENVFFVGKKIHSYKGIIGLNRLYEELKLTNPSHVCDLHDVLRTKYLRTRFRIDGKIVSCINKGRKERKKFIKSLIKTQQKTQFERYSDALKELGFPVLLDWSKPFQLLPIAKRYGIGVAPFAAHEGKIYPLDKMEEVVFQLSHYTKVFLFGGGDEERRLMESWEKKYPNVVSVVGVFENIYSEANLINTLQLIITMDSGNMHLASLVGTPVISLWGATHPLGGFLGWGQDIDNVIQKDMPCRPCSTYGSKTCRFKDYRCFLSILPEEIVDRALTLMGK